MTIRDDDNLRIKCLELAQQERAPCPDDRANTLYHQVRDDKKWPLPPREPASGWYFLPVIMLLIWMVGWVSYWPVYERDLQNWAREGQLVERP